MISAVVLFLSAISVSKACVPTSVTTTTIPCCPMLSVSVLPRKQPVISSHQCSVLNRVSSTCPEDGIIVCNAAADTNPSTMYIQVFNGNTVVRTYTGLGATLSAQVFCEEGVWVARTTATGTATAPINGVSCSQTGSQGRDLGYNPGTAQT